MLLFRVRPSGATKETVQILIEMLLFLIAGIHMVLGVYATERLLNGGILPAVAAAVVATTNVAALVAAGHGWNCCPNNAYLANLSLLFIGCGIRLFTN